MAGQADGSIIVDTELDSEGFRAGSRELQTAVKSLNKKVGSLSPTFGQALRGSEKAMESFDIKASALESTIAEVEEKMEALGNQRGPTKAYSNLSADAEKAEKALLRLYDRQDKMRDTGVKENSRSWRTLQYEISAAEEKLNRFEAQKAEMEANGTAYTSGADTVVYQQLSSTLEAVRSRLAQMRGEIEDVQSESDRLQDRWAEMPTLTGMVRSAFERIGSSVRTLTGTVKMSITHPLQAADRAAASMLRTTGRLVPVIGKAAKAFFGLSKSSKSANGGLKSGFKAMLKYGLGIRSVFVLVNKLRSAMVSGVNNLAQYSSAVNGNLSALKSSLTQLKNSFGTAFAPILSVVTPALTTLINCLSRAVTHIGMFVAALTGAKTFTKATAVQEDYAKSLSKTGSAAKDAKRQLASFDDLNILSDKNSGGSDGTAAINDMFETVSIESKIADFASQIRTAIQNKDFDFIGELIGSKINAGLQKMRSFISWDNIGGSITDTVTGITSTINSIVDNVDWNLMGATLAAGFNTFVMTLFLLFSTIDWYGIGASLADGLNGAISGIDWATLAQTVSGYVTGLLWAIIGFIEETDWQQIGHSVVTFVSNIDWSGLATALFRGIGAAFGGIGAFLWGVISDGIAAAKEFFAANIEEMGGDVVGGILLGIVKAVAGIGTWIRDNIFKPFIDGFCNAFGIHSPSTVMAEQGGFIIQGLLNGILSTLSAKIAGVKNSVKNTISSVFTNLKTSAVTWGKDICSNLASGIKSGISTVKGAVSKVADKIKSLIGFSEPEDGPLSNFHTYMPDMLDLMAEGIKANEYKAVNAVADVASAISDEVQGGDYSIGGIGVGSVAGLSRQLTGVAAMMDAANAVASSAAYRVPAVAVGTVAPYEVTARTERDDSSLADAFAASSNALGVTFAQVIADAVRTIIAAMEANGGTGGMDAETMTAAVIREINRRTRVAGKSPLLG